MLEMVSAGQVFRTASGEDCLHHLICSPAVNVSGVCSSLPSLLQAICVGPENLQVMYPAIFEQLLLFVEFSCKPPQYGRVETKHVANAKYNQVRPPTHHATSTQLFWIFCFCYIKGG